MKADAGRGRYVDVIDEFKKIKFCCPVKTMGGYEKLDGSEVYGHDDYANSQYKKDDQFARASLGLILKSEKIHSLSIA